MKKRLSSGFCCIILLLLPFLFFHKVWFARNVMVLGDFSGSDLLEMQLPHKYILRESIIKGEFPLWSVYNGTGFPVHAEGQGGYFYPINLLLVWLEPYQALNVSILLAMSIAGIGAFLLARTLPGMDNRSAFVAAAVFMFSSYFVARMKHVNMIAVACWLPLSLLFIHLGCLTRKFYYSLCLGLVWGMMFLAGHPQMAYYNVFIGLWWVSGELIYLKVVLKNKLIDLKRILLFLLISALLGVGVAAVQIIPTLELIQYSYRSTQSSFLAATAFPFNPVFLFSLFNPYLLGNPAEATYPKDIAFWGVWWENVWYVGVLPITAVLGFGIHCLVKRRWIFSHKGIAFFYYPLFVVLSGLLFAYISLGRSSVLYLFLYYVVPGMQLFRFPQRFGIVVLLAISLLFGWVLGWVFARSKRTVGTVTVFGIVLALCLGDLYLFAHRYIAFRNYGGYFPEPVDMLADTTRSKPTARIYPTFAYVENPYLFLGWQGEEMRSFETMNSMMPGNISAIYGLHSFSDRDWFEGGLDIADMSAIEWRLLGNTLDVKGLDTDSGAKVLGLWNVQYVQTVMPFENSAYTVVHSIQVDSKYYPAYYVHRNNKLMPRGFVVQSAKSFSNRDELLDYMFSEQFDPSKEALLNGVEGMANVRGESESKVEFTQYDSQYVSAEVSLASKGLFVLSDLMYPGWQVFVDGVKASAIPTNLVQRGVWLESGKHRVEWRFVPQSFYVGLVISVTTVMGCLFWLFILFFLKRYNRTI